MHSAVSTSSGTRDFRTWTPAGPGKAGLPDRVGDATATAAPAWCAVRGGEVHGDPVRQAVPPPRALSSWLRKQMIDAEREELLDARQDGRLSDGNLRVLERELDFQEQLLR